MKDTPGATVSSLANNIFQESVLVKSEEHEFDYFAPPTQTSSDLVEMDLDQSPAEQRTSRKHLRSSTDDEDLDWSSDESGKFDDADEPEGGDHRSPSAKSVKRRRSNDWPLPSEAADYGHRNARDGHGGLGANLASKSKASPRASPRGSATSLRNKHTAASSNSPRHRLGRRSRFVEANMNDSVSEEPPSIFTKESKQAGAQNRESGIFRFGRAIASAFNPFGGWGKTSPETATKTQSQKDALTQAEAAYAELKKAGFKGTNKGAYLQSQSVDQTNADQTWQAVMEKMGYGNNAGNLTPHCGDQEGQTGTPMRSPSKSSKRSSFQDLRLGRSLFKSNEPASASPMPHQERKSEDSEYTGLRKQKSKKELSRQAKLLKKVSNLEDKLERARRELRQLSGNEERLPSSTPESKRMSMDMNPGSYPRKFVPGALPTLPSERLLDQQASISESPETEAPALPSMEGQGGASLEERPEPATTPTTNNASKSSKRWSKELRPSSMGKESSSRKRKSPIPEPVASRNDPPSSPTDYIDLDGIPLEYAQLIDTGPLSPPPRQAKWQKFEAGDSPGSVERKRSSNLDHATPHETGSMHKRSPSVQSRRSSRGLHRSPDSKPKAMRSPPPLRMRRGGSNLRSVSPSNITTISDSDPAPSTNHFPPSPPSVDAAQRSFYLQSPVQLDPDRTPRSSPSKPTHTRKRSRQEEDIPPVPPLPKELLASAAKVNRSPTKTRVSRGEPTINALEAPSSSEQNRRPVLPEHYPWPADVF